MFVVSQTWTIDLHSDFKYILVAIHPFWVVTDEYFYSPLHERWGPFVVLEQPPSCSDLTCHPGHHTDQIATLSNIVQIKLQHCQILCSISHVYYCLL